MPRPKTRPKGEPREAYAAPAASRASERSAEVLTLAEAAVYLRVTEQEILHFVQEQGLPARRIGDDWRFLKAAVEGWLGTSAAPGRSQFWETHFGALKDDPYLADIVRGAYRKRGRPEDGEF